MCTLKVHSQILRGILAVPYTDTPKFIEEIQGIMPSHSSVSSASLSSIFITALLSVFAPIVEGIRLHLPQLSFSATQCPKSRISSNTSSLAKTLENFDYNTQDKLPWLENGYQTWKWNNYSINYVALGNENADGDSKEPLLLIHGFGASAYHWRYNIPYLARKYRVYAIDLLGFGLSDKPIIEYNADIWRDQVLSFIEEVVKTGGRKDGPGSGPCVVAGNSLGGYAALSAAAAPGAREKDLISGCILLNAAGRFKPSRNWLRKDSKDSKLPCF